MGSKSKIQPCNIFKSFQSRSYFVLWEKLTIKCQYHMHQSKLAVGTFLGGVGVLVCAVSRTAVKADSL